MSNASEDVFEPSLRLTSEIRLIHWESQKGKDRELAIKTLRKHNHKHRLSTLRSEAQTLLTNKKMNYYSKLIISLFLLFTITFTGIAKSATAMTLNQPTTHLGCVFLCEEHHEEHHDNTYDKGNGELWAFIAGIFAGLAAAFTFVESVSHPSIIK